VIAADENLLTVMRYLESNPLRAGMVSDSATYPWSSYVVHGLGKSTSLVDEAPVWAGLAKVAPVRRACWRDWLHKLLSASDLAAIRLSVTSGRPYGGGA
jgi:putative transposase